MKDDHRRQLAITACVAFNGGDKGGNRSSGGILAKNTALSHFRASISGSPTRSSDMTFTVGDGEAETRWQQRSRPSVWTPPDRGG